MRLTTRSDRVCMWISLLLLIVVTTAAILCDTPTAPNPKGCLKEIARVFPEAVVYTVEEAGTTTQFTLQDKHGLLRVLIEGDSVDLTSVQRLYKQPTPITDVTPPVYKDSMRVAAGDTVRLKGIPPTARDSVAIGQEQYRFLADENPAMQYLCGAPTHNPAYGTSRNCLRSAVIAQLSVLESRNGTSD